MDILLVRHGETDANVADMQGIVGNDAPLNDVGRLQASQAANICAQYDVSAIYSSPFQRCRQTAEIIGENHPEKIAITNDLKEFDMGDWAHLASAEAKELLQLHDAWDYNPTKYTFRVPGGESWEDVAHRVTNFLSQAIISHEDTDTLVLVSHNATIRAAIGIMRSRAFEGWFGFPIPNCSVSAFKYHDRIYTEIYVNHTQK